MSNYNYQLRIKSDNISQVTEILGLTSQCESDAFWMIEISESALDPPIDYFSKFLGVLEGKYGELQRIGVSRSDLSIWILYEYEDQCNIELRPENMAKLGKNGIVLCFSCWQRGEIIRFNA